MMTGHVLTLILIDMHLYGSIRSRRITVAKPLGFVQNVTLVSMVSLDKYFMSYVQLGGLQ